MEVPEYQRDYSWSTEEVEAYWFDLKAALASDQAFYFLGTVVLGHTPSGAIAVIDGQQRLATTSMLLAAARDLLQEKGDEQRASTIQGQFLAAPSLVENEVRPKLQLNAIDQPYFEASIVQLPKVTDQAVDLRPELSKAFDALKRLLRDDIDSSGPKWQDRLIRWVEFLEKRAQVICVHVADDADAFILFETLNDRGVELSVADLIKNYLLSLARADIDEAQEHWVSLTQSIEQVASSREVTPFIRQWWSSRHGATRERDLYKSLRNKVHGRDEAISVLAELDEAAPIYAALRDPTSGFWSSFDRSASEAAGVLIEMGFEQYRPLALAGLSRLSRDAGNQLMPAIVNWSVRGLIAGGIGGGTAERAWAEAAVRVANRRAQDISQILSDLGPLVPSDREFELQFANRTVLRSSYLRYLLRALLAGDALPRDEAQDLVALPLVPRRDSQGLWSSRIDDEARKELSARLGNFGIFSLEAAQSAPSEPSARLVFFEANDRLVAEYGAVGETSPAAIAARQQRLAVAATSTWPLLQDPS